MPAPVNLLKAALMADRPQMGLWLSMADPAAAEIAGASGFDWCLVDLEHGPNTLTTLRAQLLALAGTGCPAAVRVPAGQDWMIKQVLDLGAQTVVVPLVHSADQAAAMAAAVRYPPRGRRGIGASIARAASYGAVPDYLQTADAQICLFVQAESAQAIAEIDAIAGTEGVDGVFIGPADLAADMGHPGQSGHPAVQAAIAHAVARIRAAGKIAGFLTFDPAEFAPAIAQGVRFLAVGSDAVVLGHSLRALAGVARGAV